MGRGGELNWTGWTCTPPWLESNCDTDWERWRRRPCLIVGETSVELARALWGGSIVLEGLVSDSKTTFLGIGHPHQNDCRRPPCRVCSVCRHFPTIGRDMEFTPPFKLPGFGEGT